jgi:phosphoribosylglycinamide formyltransferase-1
MAQKKLVIGVLGSHSGSNFQAIYDYFKDKPNLVEFACVISNNSNAYILERARLLGIPNYHISQSKFEFPEQEIIRTLKSYNVELVVLAGYMKQISNDFLSVFPNSIINIHPSLLPKFGGEGMYGMNVHKAVKQANEKQSGATIHLVNNKYDEGRILNQAKCDLAEEDTYEDIAKKVLKVEHQLYPTTIYQIAIGKLKL